MASPSELDLKYLLLSTYYPGIKPRKLSQYRYMRRKQEMMHSIKQANLLVKGGFAHSIVNLKPKSVEKRETAASQLRRSNTSFLPRAETLTVKRKGESATFATEPSDLSGFQHQRQISFPGIWQRKMVRVNRSLKHIDDLYRRSVVDPLNLTVA